MSTFKSILQKFRDRKNQFPVNTKYPIVLAFTWHGVDYYRYESIDNTPGGRMMGCIKYYIQMSRNCDDEYLNAHYTANKANYSNPKKIDLSQYIRLNELLGERIKMGIPTPEMILKYASVVYFDKSESPTAYDDEYNMKKIERWKSSADLMGFFLQEPIRKLVPALQNVQNSTQMYLMMEARNLVEEQHLENLLQVLSTDQRNKDLISRLQSRISSLKEQRL